MKKCGIKEGDWLWSPSSERVASSNLTDYMGWLKNHKDLSFSDYDSLWQWSVDDIEGFWESIWEYYRIDSSEPYQQVLEKRVMPGANWFAGARINYAKEVLKNEQRFSTALLYLNEQTSLQSYSWARLGREVRLLAQELRRLGVKKGDRVAAYITNVPEAVVGLLACASIGAVWSSCSPDFGKGGIVDRLSQIDPKVLLCTNGYQYGGKVFDRSDSLKEIIEALPTLTRVILVPYLAPAESSVDLGDVTLWPDLMNQDDVDPETFEFEMVPFDHPLWILYSSGTTGLPKAITHSQGGILLEMKKAVGLMMDLKPEEKLFFFTTTGWMMWNFLVSSLLQGVCPVLYDGNPAYPNPDVLWKMAQDSKTSFFGSSPTYVDIMNRSGIVPGERFDLSNLKTVMLAGSPVSPECNAWFYENVKKDIWIAAGSGGTDCCTGFVGGVVTKPIYAGEMQAPALGVAARAFNEKGQPVVDEVGELVMTQPMPSMPLYFWGDNENQRYLSSYFEEYPGVWCQGDMFRINKRNGCFVLGRSDATLNRQGIRIGTAEIYRSVIQLEEVEDALVVSLDLPEQKFFMPLFVKMKPDIDLDSEIEQKIVKKIRSEYTPRHVPDKIIAVKKIPKTTSGKRMEVPVKKILMGTPAEKAANVSVMEDVGALEFFTDYAKHQRDYSIA